MLSILLRYLFCILIFELISRLRAPCSASPPLPAPAFLPPLAAAHPSSAFRFRALPSRAPELPAPREETGAPVSRERAGASSAFVRGGVASFANICLTYPVHKLMVRQSLEGLSASAAFASLRREGWAQLYRGVGPPLLQKTLSMSLMFGSFDMFRSLLSPSLPPFLASALAAALAGSSEALLCPLERVQTLLQHRHFTPLYGNGWDAARKLLPLGPAELYRGLSAVVLRNCLANALFFTLREPIAAALARHGPRGGRWHAAARDFGSGAALGALLSTLLYPLNVAKNVMQSQVGGPFVSTRATLRRVRLERGGWAGVFAGVHVNFSRSLLSWGIINMVFELTGARKGEQDNE